ncbi:MAG: HK97 family phage prohead protease [Anaerolineae bacterium]|nr:HK97 family phage prohead protease [Anaerolineae bacterium]NUQ06890.1 HK97 family phage prohead protease [Anaerolineae bacterium]
MCELCKLEMTAPREMSRRLPLETKTRPTKRETKEQQVFVTAIDAAQGIVEAIVSVFGVIDAGNDMVTPGAFAKTINERGMKVRVLDNHAADSVLRVVGIPLAMREIGREELPAEVLTRFPEATGGLWTKTQYLLDTPEGMGVFKRIAAGAAGEYSIGYEALKVGWEKMDTPDGRTVNVRLLKEIRLWEYSPVIWGMNPATATVGVKAPDPAADDETLPADEGSDPEDTQPLKTERKSSATVGVSLQTRVATAMSWLTEGWLANEIISLDEYAIINAIMVEAARMVYDGLPEGLRDRALPRYDAYMGAAGAAEAKAGRVLSAKNYGLIRGAHEALSQVMSSAGMASAEDDAEAEKTALREKAPERHAEPGEAPLTSSDIERDLIEIEMVGWS